jgi:hypothetical protein
VSVLLSEGDLKRLQELKEADGSDWCRARWACSALYALRMTDEEVQANWPKLAGRRASDVRSLIGEMKTERPEKWQLMLTRFGKEHKSVKGRAA